MILFIWENPLIFYVTFKSLGGIRLLLQKAMLLRKTHARNNFQIQKRNTNNPEKNVYLMFCGGVIVGVL